jgi:hypothetical protein
MELRWQFWKQITICHEIKEPKVYLSKSRLFAKAFLTRHIPHKELSP